MRRYVDIHLLNLSDGSPYYAPPLNAIISSTPITNNIFSVDYLLITGSRLMMYARCGEETPHEIRMIQEVLVWNWKTGYLVRESCGFGSYPLLTLPLQVLHLTSRDGSTLFDHTSKVTFLDEFRLIFLAPDHTGDLAELVLFNPLLPQDHSSNPRRFRVPPGSRNWSLVMDRDPPWGVQNRGGPLIVDPTQAIHVVELYNSDETRHFLLVLRTQALIEHARSMSTETHIPWDEWGSATMIMEVPAYSPPTMLQGVHVIAVARRATGGGEGGGINLRVFDFGLRGCSTLWSGGDGPGRAAWDEGGRDLSLEGSESVLLLGFRSLGCGGSFLYMVGRLCCWNTCDRLTLP